MSPLVDVRTSNPSAPMQVVMATLTVRDAADPEAERPQLLGTTLKRQGVHAPKLQLRDQSVP